MSILIKGMKMPKNCAECPFRKIRYSSLGKIMDCGIFGGTVGSFYKDDYDVCNIRHPKCPLVEIPKHGRLIIDADDTFGKGAFLKTYPTIIEGGTEWQ